MSAAVSDGVDSGVKRAVTYGSLTMVALCFANGLQNGEFQSFSQATESLKHAFHVSDFTLGTVSFSTGLGGAIGSIPIALLCARYARTRVLACMFAAWALLMGLQGLAPTFAIFFFLRVLMSVTEATDPAALPLISDYWPVEQRASKVGIFNAGASVGAFFGIISAGVLVDRFGWRWGLLVWVPIGIVGALLMWSRREPPRGEQDAAFRETLAALSPEAAVLEEADENLVTALIEERVDLDALEEMPGIIDPTTTTKWEVVKQIFRLRSWRVVAFGVGLTQIMQNGLMFWGTPYFKRTFDLSGTQVAGLAPIVGSGAFIGILGGGFVADRLLKRGVLRARVWVSAIGFAGAGVGYVLAFSTRSLPVAVPFLFLGTTLGAVTTGPQYALLMDVTPSSLRPQAASVTNIVQLVSALGYVVVGGLSSLFGENLRLALLCVSPMYVVGAAFVIVARRTYVADVAMVVAEARKQARP